AERGERKREATTGRKRRYSVSRPVQSSQQSNTNMEGEFGTESASFTRSRTTPRRWSWTSRPHRWTVLLRVRLAVQRPAKHSRRPCDRFDGLVTCDPPCHHSQEHAQLNLRSAGKHRSDPLQDPGQRHLLRCRLRPEKRQAQLVLDYSKGSEFGQDFGVRCAS